MTTAALAPERTAPARAAPGPVTRAERLPTIDILRGFALLGILVVNMGIFSQPSQHLVLPLPPGTPWYDVAATWLVRFLAEAKFYSLFSFLFGLGLFLQMERVEGRGGRFVPLYLRRLLVLLAIGLVHAFLIWNGDVLVLYALLGFVLLLFRRARPRTLLIWAAVLLALPVLINLASTGVVELGRATPEGAAQVDAMLGQVAAGYAAAGERALQVYATGTYAEITAQRVSDYLSVMLIGNFIMAPNVLAMFLIGVYFGRRRLFHDVAANQSFFVRLLAWGLGLGLVGNFVFASLSLGQSRADPSWRLFVATTGQTLGAPLLSLAYMSALTLLASQPAWQARLRLLAPVGQMALTNYLTQSLVCTLIFNGYGLGLFGRVGIALGLGLALVIFALQIPLSHWWLGHFRFGPAEWVWRSLTYLHPQPMRRGQQPSPPSLQAPAPR
jgi:uncharacterized protein